MADQSIFGKDDQTQNIQPAAVTPVAPVSPEPNPVDNLLHAIKNEQGEVKYASVEDALKGAAHAQGLISQNKTQLTTLAEELNALKVENAQYKGALKAMDNLNQPQPVQPTSAPAVPTGLDEAGVINLITQREKKAIEDTNRSIVINKLLEKFGDKAEEVFYNTAQKNGLSKELINQIAASSPEAALKYFDNEQPANLNPSQNSVNNDGVKPVELVINGPLPKAETSMLLGATQEELKAEVLRHREHVYKRLGITA